MATTTPRKILSLLQQREVTVATAESCTGGGIAAALTSVSGSSAWVKGGIVAYCNDVKMQLLAVPAATIENCGVVSEPVVLAMADGACRALQADVAVATSGVTGPTGGTEENPVCTVWIAVAGRDGRALTCRYSAPDEGRAANTRHAIRKALEILGEYLENEEK